MLMKDASPSEMSRARILVVDDEVSNARLMRRLLERAGCAAVDVAESGEAALALFREHSHDAVLLDLHMPRRNGFEVLVALRAELGSQGILPVIVVTADETAPTRRRAHELGASDFVLKPFVGTDIVLRVERLLQFVRWERRTAAESELRAVRAAEATARVAHAEDEMIARLEDATRFHDAATCGHTERVAALSARVARRLGLDEETVRRIGRAAPLHDLGKIAIGEDLLLKDGPLTDDEAEAMRLHTVVGASILAGSSFPVLRLAESIAFTHHERWDGHGYPQGLRGEQIPIEGRIVAVADVFDALTHERPYKAAWSREEALDEIEAQRGRQFDPRVVDALLAELHEPACVPGLEPFEGPAFGQAAPRPSLVTAGMAEAMAGTSARTMAGASTSVMAGASAGAMAGASAAGSGQAQGELQTTVFRPARPEPGLVGNGFRRPSVA